MPKMKVLLLPSAWMDLDRISDYYLTMAGTNSAQKITDKILDTIDMLKDYPYMGALHPDQLLAANGFRKALCDDYVAVYKVIDSEVFIYRIVNGRTDYPKLLK